jgi:6-phosphogluconolactonase (cycloisomerase 2 family)
LSACQDSHEVLAYAVDPETGNLAATGARSAVPAPVCVRFGASGSYVPEANLQTKR